MIPAMRSLYYYFSRAKKDAYQQVTRDKKTKGKKSVFYYDTCMKGDGELRAGKEQGPRILDQVQPRKTQRSNRTGGTLHEKE